MDTTFPSAPLSSKELVKNLIPRDSQIQNYLSDDFYVLVDLGDDEVAPVNEGDHLSF